MFSGGCGSWADTVGARCWTLQGLYLLFLIYLQKSAGGISVCPRVRLRLEPKPTEVVQPSKHFQHCMLKPEGRGGKWHKNCALVWATLNIIPVHELYNNCIGTDTSYLIYVKGEWESGFPRLCPIAGNEAQGSSPSKAVLIYKGRGSGGLFFPFFFF